MKIALIILIVLQSISGVIVGIANLLDHPFIGFFSFAVAALGLVPYIVLIRCMEEIDSLHDQCSELESKVFHLMQKDTEAESEVQRPLGGVPLGGQIIAQKRWICPKCGTVNKEKTAVCEECGAHYTLANGTIMPARLTKWKLKNK